MALVGAYAHAQAIIDTLGNAGLVVGDGEAPRPAGRSEIITPCVVFHMVDGGLVDGTLADPDEWVDARFQLTAVGRVAAEVRDIADKASAALAGGVTVAGRRVMRVQPIDPWGRVERDNDVTPPVYYCTQLWRLFSFPGAS